MHLCNTQWQGRSPYRTRPSFTLITMQNLVLLCQNIVVIRMDSVSDYVQIGVFMSAKFPNTSKFWNNDLIKCLEFPELRRVLDVTFGRSNAAVIRKWAMAISAGSGPGPPYKPAWWPNTFGFSYRCCEWRCDWWQHYTQYKNCRRLIVRYVRQKLWYAEKKTLWRT